MGNQILTINNPQAQYVVNTKEYILGKSSDLCHGVVDLSGAVSRTHCSLQLLDNGKYGVLDLDSSNGTYVNGYKIQPQTLYELHHGDILTLADVSFSVAYSDSQVLNRNRCRKDCIYKVIVFNQEFTTEILFDDIEKTGVSLGTYPECMFRFDSADNMKEFKIQFWCNSDGNYMLSCSDHLYFVVANILQDNPITLVAGQTVFVHERNTKNIMFGIATEIEYPAIGDDFDMYIDLTGYDSCVIGTDANSTVRLDDPRIEDSRLGVKVIDKGYELELMGNIQGLKVNGVILSETKPVIYDNEFFEFYGYRFCVCDRKLYTSKQSNFVTELPFGYVSYSNNHMSYPRYIRNVRQQYKIEDEDIEVLGPKPEEGGEEKNLLLTMMPVLLNMLIMVVLRGVVGGGGMFIFYCGATMLVSGTVSVVSTLSEAKTRRDKGKKRQKTYLEYVTMKEDYILEEREKEKILSNHLHPGIRENIEGALEFSNRLFEQGKEQEDYLAIRIGTGVVQSGKQITYKAEEYVETEEKLMDYPKVLHEKYEYLDNMPIMLELASLNAVGCIGTRSKLYQMAKNIIVQFAVTHFYKELKIYLILEEDDAELFAWTRMLQNLHNETLNARNIMYDQESTKVGLEFLYGELSRRENLSREEQFGEDYVLLIYKSLPVSNHPIMNYVEKAKDLGFHFIFFEEYEELLHYKCEKRIFLHNKNLEGYIQDVADGSEIQNFTYDYVSKEEALKVAMKLACVYVDEVTLENSLTKNISLYELLNIHNPYELDLRQRWDASKVYDSMAAPLGVKTGNEIVTLDIHEKAHGPHGLVAGTTGSGKSEILQSYILSMATLFHPYEVSFMIIDFKGGGMANQFRNLPHLIGTITNMDGGEVERSLLSIKAELLKRQELFASQEVNHIDDYICKYKEGQTNIALPHLILIVDEFAELKSEYPDFMKELISTARIGRSLGVHLILATQKPSGVVNEQIWSNSKFKLCLKVQNKGDSNEIIKSPLAAEIREPGRAYLQVGNNEIFQLFQSAYSGASAKSVVAEPSAKYSIYQLNLAGGKSLLFEKKPTTNEKGITQLEELVEYINTFCIKQQIKKLPPICLPPLPSKIRFDLTDFSNHDQDIEIPIGVVDDPARQTQYSEIINFTQNNIYILGASQSGKTNLLHTMIRGLTSLYSPIDVNLYIMDFASMILRSYENLAHVGGIVTLPEDEKIKTLIKMLQQMITGRRTVFSKMGFSSFSAYRESGAKDIPQVIVFLDNWIAFRNHYSEYGDAFINISRECVTVGISLVVTSSQSGGAGYKLLSNFAKRIALHCNDSNDYGFLFDSCRVRVPFLAGRGIIEKERQHYICQFYQAYDAEKEYENILKIKEHISMVNQFFGSVQVRRIPELPDVVNREYIIQTLGYKPSSEYEIPIGIECEEMGLVTIDLANTPIMGFVGDNKTGKQAYVEYLLQSICENNQAFQLYIMDDMSKTYGRFAKYGTYSNQSDDAIQMFDRIYETVAMRYENMQTGEQPVGGMPLIVTVIQSQDAMIAITKDKERADKLKKLLVVMRDMNICFLYTNVANVMAGFGANESQKLLRDEKSFFLFEDLSNVKVTDISPSIARSFKKELEYMDTYYMKKGKIIKVRCVNSQG